MVDTRRQEAGRKGGAARRDSIPLCSYCGKRPAFDPAQVHCCVKAERAGEAKALVKLDEMREALKVAERFITEGRLALSMDSPADAAIDKEIALNTIRAALAQHQKEVL